jgi:multiubiquitin
MHGNQGVGGVGPESGGFRIAVAGIDLKFREVRVADPVSTGRQIIEAAGGHPPDDFVLLQWLPDRDIEDIELDETTDLRAPGAERFIFAKSDRTFLFEIDGKRHQWPEPTITREVLIELAGQDPTKFSVWQELRNSPDKEILTGQPAKLDTPGTEKFYTVMTHTTEGRL